MRNATTNALSPGYGLPAASPSRSKIAIIPSLSDYPKSHAANYTRPVSVTPETVNLESLKNEWKKTPQQPPQKLGPKREVLIADLCDFEIYRCPDSDKWRPFELTSLHQFDVKAKNLAFDGTVRLGTVSHYLERVNIEDMSVEGYGRTSSPRIVVYLQTRLASREKHYDIWFRLRKPASTYERFHDPFLWVTMFGKLAVDYMDDQPKGSVTLESFREEFHTWLSRLFGHNGRFKTWLLEFRNVSDFRVAFHAYVNFIYNQAVNLATSKHLLSHPVWPQCKCGPTMAIERQPIKVKDTLATPHVIRSFQHMYFGSKLRQMSPLKNVSKMQLRRTRMLGFAEECTTSNPSGGLVNKRGRSSTTDVKVGDVVSIIPDEVDKTKWQKSGNEWLAYVQGIQSLRDGTQRLLLLWLYRPADTNMCLTEYPIANEVFLSDNCNCSERHILTTDVARIYTIDWKPEFLDTRRDLIIRQTYITQDSAFVTVKDSHRACSCRQPKPKSENWHAGDTVYITKITDGRQLLEPVVIHEIDYESNQMRVRLLLRLARDCPRLAAEAKRTTIAPNELVLTGKIKVMSISCIKRACRVRFVSQNVVLNDRVPFPYNLKGAGDHWFIAMGLYTANEMESLCFLEELPRGFHEAQEVRLSRRKLQGLSLFSGGGGLDRGLEEGGAVEFQTSVDYDSAAIHTQRANCHDPQKMRLFCGSVDDYLYALLTGSKNSSVARVGEVDLIAAGSPCPGFSALQHNMMSDQSLTYASHVTTFCSAVDLYRPLYGVLENVVNMASTRTGLEDQNVLSQLVACLVSMGYQVNQYIMDSWTYGSCQRRSRIILTIAAPDFEPILQRPHTHSRSYEDTSARSLGKLPNGERFGDREHYPTPFPIVSAQEASTDLPNIGNGNVQTCIAFPDHRLSRTTNSKARALIERIPRQPPGQGYAEAFQLGLIPYSLRLHKKETAKSYRRIKANELIPTITTDVNMQDARNGASVHWFQHRPLSIQEARRAQGYTDSEPIIGTLNERWKILGNGVDRKVSFTIGLALRDALVRSKNTPEPTGSLEDEAEFVVDVEEEKVSVKEYLSDGSEDAKVDPSRALSPTLSVSSSSTDSFSSARNTKERFRLSLTRDIAQHIKPPPISLPPISPPPALPHRSIELKKTSKPANGFFSHLSQSVSANISRLSLPAFPTFMPATQPSPAGKRPRDEEESEQISNPMTGRVGPYKRVKFVEVQKVPSTAPAEVTDESVSVARAVSLQPSITPHTRN